jgi:acyl dehydratase
MTGITLEELAASGERDFGASKWVTVDQEHIDLFADATGDHQWIHVDPEAAKAGPFGGTIAHGYLSLSLLPVLLSDVIHVSDQVMGVNYGIDRVRFTSPVPTGSEVRAHARLLSAEPKSGGILYKVGVQIEIKGQEKPAMVGEVLFLAFGMPDAQTQT